MRPNESFVNQPVRSLQTMLRYLSEADSRHPVVIPDGIYGKQTHRAVSEFQRIHGLPVTGAADEKTWERLVSEFELARIGVEPAQPLQLILNPNRVIQKGEESHNVYIIQSILVALADVYGSMTPPDFTGILDEQTSESIISFQYLSGLPQTGVVDKVTWQALALQYPLAVNHKESQNTSRR